MAHIQGTRDEIAYILGISNDTLERRLKEQGYATFSEWWTKYSAGGKMSLRRYQFEMAKTNATMAIWLGKQYLGQKDKQPEETDQTTVNNYYVTERDITDRKQQLKGAS
jgi:hypothetical protein